MRVGFVGLGLMGSPMALHLARGRVELAVWNRTPARTEPHRQAGAAVCASPEELAGRCRLVLICVSDTPDVEQVLFGDKGLAQGLQPGSLVVDHSTVSPAATRGWAERLAARGIGFVDAPVSGGPSGAEAGRLVAMAGGSEHDLERARPILAHYCSKVVRIGQPGAGQMMKCCNQLVTALHVLALAEGFRFAEKAGLELEKAHEVIGAGAGQSWIWDTWGGMLKDGNLEPGFKIRLHRKDLRLVLQEAERLGLRLPGLEAAAAVYERALEKGLGELGDQALGWAEEE